MAIPLERLGEELIRIQERFIDSFKEENGDFLTEELTNNVPIVSGSLKSDISKLNINKGKYSKLLIRFNTKGEAALLLEDSSLLGSFNYPRFVTFQEEPDLREWVLAANLSNDVKERFLRQGGVYVGGPNTNFGKKKWFTQSVQANVNNLSNIIERAVLRAKNK